MEAVKEQKNVSRGIDIESMQRGPRVTLDNETLCLEVKDFNLFYGDKQALHNINMQIPKNRVTAFIGPSGCGKSTLLRCFNRMNDLIESVRMEGQLLLDDMEINSPSVNVADLRRQVGMVFQKPNPFPKSIYENVAYGLRLQGVNDRSTLDKVVEKSLKGAALWDEVKDKLHQDGTSLSGGQQQRLCIARTLAINPPIILMDEPTSALDPIATVKIEDLMNEIKKEYTVIVVTHNMQQARRIADYTSFFVLGDLIEHGLTSDIFTNPKEKKTEDYISGNFG